MKRNICKLIKLRLQNKQQQRNQDIDQGGIFSDLISIKQNQPILKLKYYLSSIFIHCDFMQPKKIIGPTQMYTNDILGTGSNSSVFKGKLKTSFSSQITHSIQEIQVAVKVVPHSQRYENQVTQYLFDSEKQALTTLNHPNVVRCFGVFQDDVGSYFALQRIHGHSLKHYIKSKGLINQKDAVYILQKLLHALNQIAIHGFIHRDIKSANIMIKQLIDKNTNEKILEPVIIDFGFSQRVNYKKKPQIFYNVGSPSFMAPQSYALTKYSEKSDLWSLGVVFYQMLTGETLDSNIKIEEFFANPSYFIEKKISQNIYRLSTRCIKILRNILVVNEIDRPSVKTTRDFIQKIDQNNQRLLKKKKQTIFINQINKNTETPNLLYVLKNSHNQTRMRMPSIIEKINDSFVQQRTVIKESPRQMITFMPKKEVKTVKRIRSERVITDPIQINRINNSFVQPQMQRIPQIQRNFEIKKDVHIVSINNGDNNNRIVRRTYQSPNPTIINPEVKRVEKITFNYRQPSHSLYQSQNGLQFSQR